MKKSQTPLSKVKNFGPVSPIEYESMGITTLEQIENIGFEDMCRKYVQYYPDRLNANAFLGIVCALEGTVWTKATASQRAKAKQMVAILRQEFHLKPTKVKKSNRAK